ncbi:hypothetical protein [Chryseobacterium sp. SG20098]|nr:hypothetical protein [Chryseobacterium sp. SG20098]WNI36559.1 hypothetical protein RHP76_21850 [Chryseobacterium sp. SG20098]
MKGVAGEDGVDQKQSFFYALNSLSEWLIFTKNIFVFLASPATPASP